MRSKLISASAALVSMVTSFAANAGSTGGNTVPEPGTWALVGLAAAVGWAVTRSKRK